MAWLAPLAMTGVLVASPVSAQTTGNGPVATDPAEANVPSDARPIRIGNVNITGSFHLDTLAQEVNDEVIDDVKVRRARIGAAGPLSPRVAWNVSAELTTKSTLRQALIQVRLANPLNIRFGQFTPPNGIERGTSPTAIELIDRSRATRELTYSQDIGVSLFSVSPIARTISYAVSVVNGSGFNRLDNNRAKDVVGRVELLVPQVRHLSVVASAGAGRQPASTRTRNTLGAQYDSGRMKLMAEGLREHRHGFGVRDGAVMMGIYRIRPRVARAHFRLLELATRFVVLDDPLAARGISSNTVDEDAPAGASTTIDVVPVTTRELQAGGNYYVNRNVRVMLDGIFPADARTTPGTSVVVRLQVVF